MLFWCQCSEQLQKIKIKLQTSFLIRNDLWASDDKATNSRNANPCLPEGTSLWNITYLKLSSNSRKEHHVKFFWSHKSTKMSRHGFIKVNCKAKFSFGKVCKPFRIRDTRNFWTTTGGFKEAVINWFIRTDLGTILTRSNGQCHSYIKEEKIKIIDLAQQKDLHDGVEECTLPVLPCHGQHLSTLKTFHSFILKKMKRNKKIRPINILTAPTK